MVFLGGGSGAVQPRMNKTASDDVENFQYLMCTSEAAGQREAPSPGVYNRSGPPVTWSSHMFRFALPMLLSTGLLMSGGLPAAVASVDIETAATIYQDASMREQV